MGKEIIYKFTPQEDITIQELADILAHTLFAEMTVDPDYEDQFNLVRRHFKIVQE